VRGVAVLGGSFDPVHVAHLIVAERIREATAAERVLLVPAARQPLKPEGPRASGADRLAMLRLAVADNPALVPEPIELDRGGTSWTAETLEELARREPATTLFLAMGSDAYATLDRWRRAHDVRRLARLAVVDRPGREGRGSELPPDVLRVDVPRLDVSATDVRARVARGASIRYLVPEAVRAYILERGLYRA
jgi:nicotinate-nucleotide adenylyltransferase